MKHLLGLKPIFCKTRCFKNSIQKVGLVSIFFGSAVMLPVLFLEGCGRNIAKSQAPANPEEQAQLDMEAGRYAAAQTKLESLLQTDPTNYKATSLLAASHAAQGGITMFALLQKAAESQTSSGASGSAGSGDTLTTMLGILPDVTSLVLEKMELACQTIGSIPTDVRTTEMTLQNSVFFSSLAFLKLKQLKENPDLLAALTPEQAASILSNLASAVPASSTATDPISKGSSALQKSITSAEGSNDVIKLKFVLSASSSP